MKYAIIENGKIINTAVSDSALAENWVELQDGFSKGDLYENGVFSKPPIDLVEYKDTTRTRLKSERDTIIDQPINNVQVATISDRENIQGYLLYETEEPIEWVMADNTFQLLMKTDLEVIQSTYISRKKLAYEAYANACRALEAATTQAEIEAVEVTL